MIDYLIELVVGVVILVALLTFMTMALDGKAAMDQCMTLHSEQVCINILN